MALPIEVKSSLALHSLEYGASNRSTGVFRFYSHLKLAHSLSLSDAKSMAINSKIVERQTWHTYYIMNIVSLMVSVFFYTLKCNKILNPLHKLYSLNTKCSKFAFQQS
jgi:hypothetical protein